MVTFRFLMSILGPRLIRSERLLEWKEVQETGIFRVMYYVRWFLRFLLKYMAASVPKLPYDLHLSSLATLLQCGINRAGQVTASWQVDN